MNHSFHLKCVVCESTYLIKHQIGYRSTEFYFECPKCGIMLSGNVNIDNENVKFSATFHNLEQFNQETQVEAKLDYFIQLSGEFYDNKLKEGSGSDWYMPGSFILNSNEKIEEIGRLSQYIIEYIPFAYDKCSRVIQLIVNNKENQKYVFSELDKMDSHFKKFINYKTDEKSFFESYDQEKNSILFKCVCIPFKLLFEKNSESFRFDNRRNELEKIFQNNKDEIEKMKLVFEDIFPEMIKSIVGKLGTYTKLLPKLTPIITSETLHINDIDSIKQYKGLNTVDYNELLANYADVYEILGKFIPVMVLIDNILKRGNMSSFCDYTYDDLDKFLKDSIGNKLSYLKKISSNNLKYMDMSILNNKIRNSINHYSYEYDSLNQIIHFKDRNKVTNMYLIEFANDNYKLMYLLIDALFILCSLSSKFLKME